MIFNPQHSKITYRKGVTVVVDKKKDFLKILGNNMNHIRSHELLSQEALANLCGWNTDNARSTISKIEKGTNDVPMVLWAS